MMASRAYLKMHEIYEVNGAPQTDANFDEWVSELKKLIVVEPFNYEGLPEGAQPNLVNEYLHMDDLAKQLFHQKFGRLRDNILEARFMGMLCHMAFTEYYLELNSIDQAIGSLCMVSKLCGAFLGIHVAGVVTARENNSRRDYSEYETVKEEVKDFYLLHFKQQVDSKKILKKTVIANIQTSNEKWQKLSDRQISGYIRELYQ